MMWRKLTIPGSSNLNLSYSEAKQRVLCKKDEKNVLHCFTKLNANLSYHLLTLFPAEAVAMKQWNSKTRDYHKKLNGRVALRIDERFKT